MAKAAKNVKLGKTAKKTVTAKKRISESETRKAKILNQKSAKPKILNQKSAKPQKLDGLLPVGGESLPAGKPTAAKRPGRKSKAVVSLKQVNLAPVSPARDDTFSKLDAPDRAAHLTERAKASMIDNFKHRAKGAPDELLQQAIDGHAVVRLAEAPRKKPRPPNFVEREIARRAESYAKLSEAAKARVARELERATDRQADPLRAIIVGNLNPEHVLPEYQHKAAGRVVDQSPVYNLRFGLSAEHAITHEQYEAACRYKQLHDQYALLPSNTASALARLEGSPVWTAKDIEKMRTGEMLRPMGGGGGAKREMPIVGEAIRQVEKLIDRFDRAILKDLIVNELTVGQMAVRYRQQPQGMAAIVRMCLWKLVAAMEAADAVFRVYLVQHRETPL